MEASPSLRSERFPHRQVQLCGTGAFFVKIIGRDFYKMLKHCSIFFSEIQRMFRFEDRGYPLPIVALCGQLAYVFELGVKRCGAKKSDAPFNDFCDKACQTLKSLTKANP